VNKIILIVYQPKFWKCSWATSSSGCGITPLDKGMQSSLVQPQLEICGILKDKCGFDILKPLSLLISGIYKSTEILSK
jgi:hypothetical protein